MNNTPTPPMRPTRITHLAAPDPITLVSNGHRITIPPCPPDCTCRGRRTDELELTPAELIAEHTGRREYLES